VYVSLGHRCDLAWAAGIVLACAPRYRLPEPIRAADRLAGALSRLAAETRRRPTA
jgi:deoxyribonuclease V